MNQERKTLTYNPLKMNPLSRLSVVVFGEQGQYYKPFRDHREAEEVFESDSWAMQLIRNITYVKYKRFKKNRCRIRK